MSEDNYDEEISWIGPVPSIILIEPQMGENIGAAARAMWNFGLPHMRIVNPRDEWQAEQAKLWIQYKY